MANPPFSFQKKWTLCVIRYFHPSRLIENKHATVLEEAEKNSKIEIAKNLIKDGVDIKTIQKYTKLPLE